jgi:transcriptional regulator with XRE-family HTH domain
MLLTLPSIFKNGIFIKDRGTYMTTRSSLWRRLANSREFRREFVAISAKRGIPFQMRALLKKRGWSQEVLAKESGLTQGVVSRAISPDYGNVTLNTIVKIAGGYDVAFVGHFVPFSELEKWFEGLSEEVIASIPSFPEENALAPLGKISESAMILGQIRKQKAESLGASAAAA